MTFSVLSNASDVSFLFTTLQNGEVLVYSSGLSAAFAALMLLSPDVIAIRDGYRGCHEVYKVLLYLNWSLRPL